MKNGFWPHQTPLRRISDKLSLLVHCHYMNSIKFLSYAELLTEYGAKYVTTPLWFRPFLMSVERDDNFELNLKMKNK